MEDNKTFNPRFKHHKVTKMFVSGQLFIKNVKLFHDDKNAVLPNLKTLRITIDVKKSNKKLLAELIKFDRLFEMGYYDQRKITEDGSKIMIASLDYTSFMNGYDKCTLVDKDRKFTELKSIDDTLQSIITKGNDLELTALYESDKTVSLTKPNEIKYIELCDLIDFSALIKTKIGYNTKFTDNTANDDDKLLNKKNIAFMVIESFTIPYQEHIHSRFIVHKEKPVSDESLNKFHKKKDIVSNIVGLLKKK